MMENGIAVAFFVIFTFACGLIGYQIGSYDSMVAIHECEKELPRNVDCKIVDVPVDRN